MQEIVSYNMQEIVSYKFRKTVLFLFFFYSSWKTYYSTIVDNTIYIHKYLQQYNSDNY